MVKRGVILLTAVITVALSVLMYQEYHHEQELRQHIDELIAQAAPYEKQRDEIMDKLFQMDQEAYKEAGPNMAIVGFHVRTLEEVAMAQSLSAEFGFSPVLVMDCDVSEEMKDTVKGIDCGRILTQTPFDANQAAEMHQRMWCTNFLLRKEDDTQENRQALKADGIKILIQHTDNITDYMADGVTYMGYSFITQDGNAPIDRLNTLPDQRTALLLVFDLGRVAEGTLTEDGIRSTISTIRTRAESGVLTQATIQQAMDKLAEMKAAEEQRMQEYEKQKAEEQAKLEELESVIDQIYSGLSEKK